MHKVESLINSWNVFSLCKPFSLRVHSTALSYGRLAGFTFIFWYAPTDLSCADGYAFVTIKPFEICRHLDNSHESGHLRWRARVHQSFDREHIRADSSKSVLSLRNGFRHRVCPRTDDRHPKCSANSSQNACCPCQLPKGHQLNAATSNVNRTWLIRFVSHSVPAVRRK